MGNITKQKRDEMLKFLEQLKKELGESLSEDELDKIYSEYGSEDEYWEYEKKVYRIDLPIQKYAASLEEEFKMKNGKNISADLLQEKWDQEYQKIKNKLVRAQQYKKAE